MLEPGNNDHDWNAEQGRANLRLLADVLRNPEEPVERLQAAVQDLEPMLKALHGVSSAVVDESQRFRRPSPSGEVISPGYAVSTMQDAVRTAKFLRGLIASIDAATAKFPGERIHIAYAGPGPNLPFFLLVTPYFSPKEVSFTLIELMPESAQAAKRVVEAFGFQDYLNKLIQGNAAEYRHAGTPFHITIAEIMLRGLRGEGQFAVFKNLVPQMAPGGFLVPQEIELRAMLTDPHRELSNLKEYPPPAEALALRRDMGTILRLSSKELLAAHAQDPEAYAKAESWPVPDFKIPPLETSAATWAIMTGIRLFGDIVLEEGESGLTYPLHEIDLPPVQEGDEIQCEFRLGPNPGLYCKHHRPRPSILDGTI